MALWSSVVSESTFKPLGFPEAKKAHLVSVQVFGLQQGKPLVATPLFGPETNVFVQVSLRSSDLDRSHWLVKREFCLAVWIVFS